MIGDLIKNKDYDYVSYRLTLPDGDNAFAGCFSSKGGEIISLDGDNYYNKDEKVLSSTFEPAAPLLLATCKYFCALTFLI